MLSAEQQQATLGYLRTLKALLFMRIVEVHDTAGAPIDMDIPADRSASAARCANDVKQYIAALLDSAATNLAAGGESFPFTLPPGFADFNDPASFLTFNRALAAKIDIYIAFRDYAASGTIDQSALTAASTALGSSFLPTTPMLETSMSDQARLQHELRRCRQSSLRGSEQTLYRANPRVVTEADPGDQRVARRSLRPRPLRSPA